MHGNTSFFSLIYSVSPFDFRVRLFNILALGGTVISLIMALLSLATGSWGKCPDQHCAGRSLRRTFSLFLLQWEISAMLSDHHCHDFSDRFSGDVFYQRRISWRYAGLLRVCHYFYRADAGKKTGSDRFSAGDCPIYRTVSGRIPFSALCNSFCHGSRPAGRYSSGICLCKYCLRHCSLFSSEGI